VHRPVYNPYVTALLGIAIVLGFIGVVLLVLGQGLWGAALLGGGVLAALLLLAASAVRWSAPRD
jgi:hypothetical protein